MAKQSNWKMGSRGDCGLKAGMNGDPGEEQGYSKFEIFSLGLGLSGLAECPER